MKMKNQMTDQTTWRTPTVASMTTPLSSRATYAGFVPPLKGN